MSIEYAEPTPVYEGPPRNQYEDRVPVPIRRHTNERLASIEDGGSVEDNLFGAVLYAYVQGRKDEQDNMHAFLNGERP